MGGGATGLRGAAHRAAERQGGAPAEGRRRTHSAHATKKACAQAARHSEDTAAAPTHSSGLGMSARWPGRRERTCTACAGSSIRSSRASSSPSTTCQQKKDRDRCSCQRKPRKAAHRGAPQPQCETVPLCCIHTQVANSNTRRAAPPLRARPACQPACLPACRQPGAAPSPPPAPTQHQETSAGPPWTWHAID